VRDYYYQKMAIAHRKWRGEMTKVWRAGETPNFAKQHIEEKDWEIFVKYRETEEFDVCLFLWTTYFTSN